MGNKIEKEQIIVETIKNSIYECKFKLVIVSGGEMVSLNSQFVVFNLNRSKLKCKFPDNKLFEFDVASEVTVIKYKIEKRTMKLKVRVSGTDCLWKIEAQNAKSFMDWKEALMFSKRPCWLLSPICQICSRKFGTFFRAHHCRYCGKAVCDHCSKLEAKIEIYGYKHPQRICSPCARRLVIENETLMKSARLKRASTQSAFAISDLEGGAFSTVRNKRSSSVVYNNLIDYQK